MKLFPIHSSLQINVKSKGERAGEITLISDLRWYWPIKWRDPLVDKSLDRIDLLIACHLFWWSQQWPKILAPISTQWSTIYQSWAWKVSFQSRQELNDMSHRIVILSDALSDAINLCIARVTYVPLSCICCWYEWMKVNTVHSDHGIPHVSFGECFLYLPWTSSILEGKFSGKWS